MTQTLELAPAPTSDHLALDQRAQDLLFRQARTANAFTRDPVSDEHVQAIYELVKWAPTSMNNQPLRITLVRTREARERLVSHLMEGNKAKTATAPLVAILTADHDFHENLPQVFPHVPGLRDMYAEHPGRTDVARFNASLQVGYFIIGVRAAGLAAGPMTGYDAESLTADFFPAGDRTVLAVVNIGHPADDAWFDRLPRLPFGDVVDVA